MPKVKTINYVKALDRLVTDKSRVVASENFAGFLQLLKKNHQLNLVPMILDLYQKKINEGGPTLLATVYYQDEKPGSIAIERIKSLLRKRFDVDEVNLNFESKAIGPGLIVDVCSSRFNFSLKKQVESFREKLLETT